MTCPPLQVHHLQHVVQQLAPPAHEGLALQILVLAGALADAHDLGVYTLPSAVEFCMTRRNRNAVQ